MGCQPSKGEKATSSSSSSSKASAKRGGKFTKGSKAARNQACGVFCHCDSSVQQV